jgi:addiction module HigA family antidote
MTDPETLIPEGLYQEDLEPIPPIHPGEDLAEIIGELEISPERLAKTIGISTNTINAILEGNHPITGDIAMRLAKAFYMSPEFWLNLQKLYELESAKISTDTGFIVPLVPAPNDAMLRAPVAKFVNL